MSTRHLASHTNEDPDVPVIAAKGTISCNTCLCHLSSAGTVGATINTTEAPTPPSAIDVAVGDRSAAPSSPQGDCCFDTGCSSEGL